MNHVPPHAFATDARPLTRRAMAKMRTRQTVLQAAKKLIAERGYEEATVRDIARAAGMSTGAVFANFSDKADLFAEIRRADDEALASRMHRAASEELPVREAILGLLKVGYDFHLAQLPLLQAANSVSWSHRSEEEDRRRVSLRPMLSLIEEALRRGVRAKALAADIDIELTADLIWQAYCSNYRLAVFDGYGEDALIQRAARQLDLVLSAIKRG